MFSTMSLVTILSEAQYQACGSFCCDRFKSWNPTAVFFFWDLQTGSGMCLCQFVVGWNINLSLTENPSEQLILRIYTFKSFYQAGKLISIHQSFRADLNFSVLSILNFEHTRKKILYNMVFINGWVENREQSRPRHSMGNLEKPSLKYELLLSRRDK